MIKYVPVQLIQFALTTRITSEFRTFLYLKAYSKTGVIKISTKERANLENGLGISRWTLRRHLKTLQELKWIGHDSHENYFLRNWESLKRICGIEFKSRVEFSLSYITKENHIGYFMGTVIAYQCKLKKVKEWKERKIGRSKQSPSKLYPISISYLSNLLEIPESTVRSYKKKAIQAKFVFRKRNREKLDVKLNNINLKEFQEQYINEPCYPLIVKKRIYLIHPDSFSSDLAFKRYRR